MFNRFVHVHKNKHVFGSFVFGVLTGSLTCSSGFWSNYWDSIDIESKKRIAYK